MSPLRLVCYLQLFLLVPFGLYLMTFMNESKELDLMKEQIKVFEMRLVRQKERGALNKLLAEHYQGKEVRKREELIAQKLFKDVHFIEGKIEKAPLFQEVSVQLARPLLLNGTELKQLLSILEERTIPPYESSVLPGLCLISDITLLRTEKEGRELFEVNLKFLKREFL